ncbi:flagellar protein FlaG [Persephonella hydrogeniphila]|uniref:Flagellar protein FlaG n=1 Tax=Persephonella hydrogeniphila TaxID=198703 RepID=A0A285N2U9_9AQUI|nr:flagellar protein FlaG [Persephonella hydrogeniphila]SNZ03750.1 flagellar protein FlaG [Persephonella hydrogeniphila]
MDIKAISGTQASINMNSQNVEALDKKQVQKVQQDQQKDQTQKIENQQEAKNVPPEVLKKSIEDLNKKFEMLNSQLKVEVDEDTGIRVIKIVDKETKEVIRQIPPEVMLKIAKYLDEVAGLLFNEKV